MTDFLNLDAQEASSYLPPVFSSDTQSLKEFSSFILSFYEKHGRVFAWRQTSDPYRIHLSEVMLQQTQTSRVQPKYELFLSLWPTFKELSEATLEELLFNWKGLGYNRRALNLRKSARLTEQWGWTIPNDPKAIASLPGVGKATSAALLAFCYQERSIYLETNIRRVLLTCFFHECEGVKDKELEALLGELASLQSDIKSWYYALMDYGVLLKHLLPNANTRSAHYTKQGTFEQSNRQIRGALIHLLSDTGGKDERALHSILNAFEPERITYCLKQLQREGFVQERQGVYRISED